MPVRACVLFVFYKGPVPLLSHFLAAPFHSPADYAGIESLRWSLGLEIVGGFDGREIQWKVTAPSSPIVKKPSFRIRVTD
jgi:hypothetical protein